jgi:hypothetical protein
MLSITSQRRIFHLNKNKCFALAGYPSVGEISFGQGKNKYSEIEF